ncbi:c-type cytochrome [Candidatus Poribacteria bacterium]|nr:c-type cytochrome [Candidatus Poribacteria bacterium]
MRKIVTAGLSILLVTSLAFLASAEISDKAQLGRELFYDPSFGGTLDPKKVSGLACATCHADFDEAANPDGKIRAGHSIVGVPHRGSAKGGMIKGEMFTRAAGGGGFCYEHFLQKIPDDKVNPTNIPAEQAEALMAYFEYVSGDNKGPKFEMKMLDKDAASAAADKIVEMKGDSNKGWSLFSRTCNDCHPTAIKAGIGTRLVRPGRPPANLQKRLHKIARYARSGGSVMPFFAEDRLSDQNLADILAFISELYGGGKSSSQKKKTP